MDLQAQIDELKRKIEELEKSNTIPRSVETAFRNRLGDIKNTPGSSTNYTYTVAVGDVLTLPTITGVLPTVVNGKTYNLMYQ